MLRSTFYVIATALGWQAPDPQPEEPEISSASSIPASSTCEPTLASVSQVPPVQTPDEAPEPNNPAGAVMAEDEETGLLVESADLQPDEPEHQSSRSPYQLLAPSLEEFKQLQANRHANRSAVRAEVSALKEPPPPDWEKGFKVQRLKDPPPPDWKKFREHGCMIQEQEAALTKSVYFISLLRVLSLLTRPSEARHRISRYLAAGGWITIFVITAASQFFLMVLILETSTSNTCDVEYQTGCSSGEYCSFSIARGQCNDCSVILPKTSTCCPTLNTICPAVEFAYNYTYSYTSQNSQIWSPCEDGCPHACVMYQHCITETASREKLPRRCDFLVRGRYGVKWSHIFLLIFGAVLWATKLVEILDETDMIAATMPRGIPCCSPGCPTGKSTRSAGKKRETHYAIFLLFKVMFSAMFTLRTSVLPALSAVGAIVAILTDGNGTSLSGGLSLTTGGRTTVIVLARHSSTCAPVDITCALSPLLPRRLRPILVHCAQLRRASG